MAKGVRTPNPCNDKPLQRHRKFLQIERCNRTTVGKRSLGLRDGMIRRRSTVDRSIDIPQDLHDLVNLLNLPLLVKPCRCKRCVQHFRSGKFPTRWASPCEASWLHVSRSPSGPPALKKKPIGPKPRCCTDAFALNFKVFNCLRMALICMSIFVASHTCRQHSVNSLTKLCKNVFPFSFCQE